MSVRHDYKLYTVLSMVYITFIISADLLIYKIIRIGPYVMSVGSFITPFWFVITDVIAEVYGYQLTRKLVWSGLFCSLLFAIISASLIHVPSPPFWHYQSDYSQVLGKMPRVFLGSLAGLFLGSFINAYLIVKWKILMRGKYFWIRSIGSSGLGQLAFTMITIIIDLTGILSLRQVLELIIISYTIKLIVTPLIAIPSTLLTNYLKRVENVDAYDYNTDFNPFKFTDDGNNGA